MFCGEEGYTMSKWKIAELILAAVSTLIAAARALLKFIGLIGKLRTKPAEAG